MGKKTDERKAQKKAEKEAENQAILEIQSRVKEANAIEDLMASYPAFKKYERKGLNLEIGFCKGADLPEETVEWAMELMKETMGEIYEKNFGALNTAEKRAMLLDPDARYLLFYPLLGEDFRGDPMGFVHFRWEMEQVAPVLYIYEIILEEPLRRKGLASFAVKFLELVARRTNMEWIMTTVPLGMDPAFKLMAKCGLAMDMESPGAIYTDPAERPKNLNYEILSKCFLPESVQKEHMETLKMKNLQGFNANSKMAQLRLQQLMLK